MPSIPADRNVQTHASAVPTRFAMTTSSRAHVRSTQCDDVWIVTLDRASRANAYTTDMLRDFANLLDEAEHAVDIRAAVITGAGGAFSGGADLGELSSRDEKDALDLLSRDVFDRWARAPWPTIAAITGAAVGGGFELALACDVRVCGRHARFAFPELSHGLVPAAGGIRRLVAQVGTARTSELVLFARTLDAETAVSWGIAAAVVDEPLAYAVDWARGRRSPDAIAARLAKMLIEDAAGGLVGRNVEAIAQALCYRRRQLRTQSEQQISGDA